jgi:hypothetical protein
MKFAPGHYAPAARNGCFQRILEATAASIWWRGFQSASQEKSMMKKMFALLFAMGVTLCTAATANAQALKVDVPFDFVIDGKILPAATYTVLQSLPNDKRGLAFMGEDHGILTLASEFDTQVTGTKLVFSRIGDEYFLKDVVTPEGRLHFAASRKQTQLARAAEQQSLTVVESN